MVIEERMVKRMADIMIALEYWKTIDFSLGCWLSLMVYWGELLGGLVTENRKVFCQQKPWRMCQNMSENFQVKNPGKAFSNFPGSWQLTINLLHPKTLVDWLQATQGTTLARGAVASAPDSEVHGWSVGQLGMFWNKTITKTLQFQLTLLTWMFQEVKING